MSTSASPTHALARQLRELVGLYLVEQRRWAHDQGLAQQNRLLMLLQKHGARPQGELGRMAGLDKSWFSRIVERFVEEGLVQRTPLESDRRCIMLSLTEAGRLEAARYDALLTRHTESFLARVPVHALPALQPALETLITALQASAEPGEVRS